MNWKSLIELAAVAGAAYAVFNFAEGRNKLFALKPGQGDTPAQVETPAADPTLTPTVSYLNYNLTNGRNDIIAPGGSSDSPEVLSGPMALEKAASGQSYGAWSNYVSVLE